MAHTHVSYNMYVNNAITDANHVNNIKQFISTDNSILEINCMNNFLVRIESISLHYSFLCLICFVLCLQTL